MTAALAPLWRPVDDEPLFLPELLHGADAIPLICAPGSSATSPRSPPPGRLRCTPAPRSTPCTSATTSSFAATGPRCSTHHCSCHCIRAAHHARHCR